MTKADLRRRLAADLRAWAAGGDGIRAGSDAICRGVAGHRAWRGARLICAFLPLPREPQIAPLWEKNRGAAFCFPQVRGESVELIRIDDAASLAAADWKLAGPQFASAPIVTPDGVDLFLVPGLAFTCGGRRLGRGGGYYDRLLARRHPGSVALGVCFSIQLVDALPAEPHDQPVDAVITEYGPAPAAT